MTEQQKAKALAQIEVGFWTSKTHGLQKAGRGVMMDMAGKALAEWRKG